MKLFPAIVMEVSEERAEREVPQLAGSKPSSWLNPTSRMYRAARELSVAPQALGRLPVKWLCAKELRARVFGGGQRQA